MADSDTTGTSVATIAPELQIVDGHVTTTSTQVAQHFNKRHDTVLRAIRNLLAELDADHARNFAEMIVEVEIGKGATRQDPAYRMTRDGFTLLAMGFTGKEALQWKLAYIDTFNKMEAALTSGTSDRISPAQKQHLKELVDLIVASGKQDYPGTWARFQRKMGCNKYELLHPSKFADAVAYLQGKLDDQSIATLIQKHLPSAVPALKPPVSPPALPPTVIDMDRIQLAMAAANETAAKAQSVMFRHLLEGKEGFQYQSWILSFIVDGKDGTISPRAKQLESEAFAMTLTQLAAAINGEGGFLISNADLVNLASACNNRLAQRIPLKAA